MGLFLVGFRTCVAISLVQYGNIMTGSGNIPHPRLTPVHYLLPLGPPAVPIHISLHPLEPIMSPHPMPNWGENEMKIRASSPYRVTPSWTPNTFSLKEPASEPPSSHKCQQMHSPIRPCDEKLSKSP